MGSRLDKVFRISVILKGLDAAIEIIGGIGLLFVDAHDIQRFVHWLINTGLFDDPHDYIASLLTHGTHRMTASSTLFAAVYLLSHGVIKLFVIINVLRNKYWAYPLLIIVLFGFLIYQIIDVVQTQSIGMILLSIFDIFVIILTWLEWQKRRSARHKVAAKPAEEEGK